MLHLTPSLQLPRTRRGTRLGEWWPAALLALVALLLINQGHAQAAQQASQPTIDLQQAADDGVAKRWRLADFATPLAVGPLNGN